MSNGLMFDEFAVILKLIELELTRNKNKPANYHILSLCWIAQRRINTVQYSIDQFCCFNLLLIAFLRLNV